MKTEVPYMYMIHLLNAWTLFVFFNQRWLFQHCIILVKFVKHSAVCFQISAGQLYLQVHSTCYNSTVGLLSLSTTHQGAPNSKRDMEKSPVVDSLRGNLEHIRGSRGPPNFFLLLYSLQLYIMCALFVSCRVAPQGFIGVALAWSRSLTYPPAQLKSSMGTLP